MGDSVVAAVFMESGDVLSVAVGVVITHALTDSDWLIRAGGIG